LPQFAPEVFEDVDIDGLKTTHGLETAPARSTGT
jgi:hypothetical protein